MPKLKTIRVAYDERTSFAYTVNVDKEGTFSTTLPTELVELLEEAGLLMHKNRLGNKGYYYGMTLEDVENQVAEAIKEATTLHEVSRELVLKYAIETVCSYCKNSKGEFVPNGYWDDRKDGYKWLGGTKRVDATHREPFGYSFYVDVREKVLMESKSGRRKVEFRTPQPQAVKDVGPNAWFLAEIPCMYPPRDAKVHEMPLTDALCEFFVQLFKATCTLTERFHELIDPEKLTAAIEKGEARLLG